MGGLEWICSIGPAIVSEDWRSNSKEMLIIEFQKQVKSYNESKKITNCVLNYPLVERG